METKEYFQRNWKRFLEEAKEYLAIKSISTQPKYRDEIQKAVAWLVEHFRRLGLKVKVWKAGGHPFVFASTVDKKEKPTVLIYGHYDVQPPDPIEEWHSPPFKATIRKGALFARGATDNKLQHLVYLLALEYLLSCQRELFFNIKFIIEGEEEIGSASSGAVLEDHRRELKADLVLVSDGPMVKKDQPTITTGTRGLLYTELELEVGRSDLHSGLFGGGVDNAAHLMAWVVSRLKDRKNRVLIPGFYRKVAPLTVEEKRSYKSLPLKEKDFQENAGVFAVLPEPGFSVFGATTLRPTVDVNGLWSGYTGKGLKTIIPAKAGAKISFRLVPNQKPEVVFRQLETYLKRIMPKTCRWRLKKVEFLDPYVWKGEEKWLEKAARALEKIWQKKVVFYRSGGSIGILDLFKKKLGADCLLVELGSPDDNLHAPNEKFDLKNFQKGFLFAVEFLGGEKR